MKVTCELRDYSEPAMPSIRVHNHWPFGSMVEIEVDGKRYVVSGREVIRAVQNCMDVEN